MRKYQECAPRANRRLCRADCKCSTWACGAVREVSESLTREQAADACREQAAACRRLARNARTPNGHAALTAVADQFDEDARRIDPLSECR